MSIYIPMPRGPWKSLTESGMPAMFILRCYDAVRPHRLPAELANKNPTGKMWRLIDGNWSQGDVPE